MKKTLSLFIALMFVSACTDQNGKPIIKKQHIGAIAGAIGGAYAAKNVGKGDGRVAAIAAGTLIGSFLGNELGKSLDKADRNYYANTLQKSLENSKTGNVSTWKNPDSKNSGSFKPTKTIKRDSGEYCREFTQTINIGGKEEKAYGTACRKPDGSWKIQN